MSSLPVLIGCDEFPVGYSLPGCPPAEHRLRTILNTQTRLTMALQQTATAPLNFVSQAKGALQSRFLSFASLRVGMRRCRGRFLIR